jgi:hypothetical protein
MGRFACTSEWPSGAEAIILAHVSGARAEPRATHSNCVSHSKNFQRENQKEKQNENGRQTYPVISTQSPHTLPLTPYPSHLTPIILQSYNPIILTNQFSPMFGTQQTKRL